MANVYNRPKKNLGDGTIDWDSASIKAMLVTSSYAFNADHNFRNQVTNEITNGGYARTALANKTVTQDDTNDRAVYDADDTTFASLAAGDQPAAAIVFVDTGNAATDILICYTALTSPPAPNGGDYKIVWASAGVFNLT